MNEDFAEHYGFQFKIDGLESINMINGEKAFVLYLVVDNQTQNARKINLLKATYVTAKREQIEQEDWLNGYISGEDIIKPNSYKKAGLVFYKSRLKAIADNDYVYVTIELTQEGVGITLCFRKTENTWLLINKEEIDVQIKFTPQQLEKNLLKRIERFDAFEEKFSIYFENLNIKNSHWNDGSFDIYGEMHSKDGPNLKESIRVVCALYDTEGKILEQQTHIVFRIEDFFGFEIFEMKFLEAGIAYKVGKIRIFPKKY